jgi:hypothetical protein
VALSRGFPRVGLPTTLPCGVRTFLEGPVVSPVSPRLLGRQLSMVGGKAPGVDLAIDAPSGLSDKFVLVAERKSSMAVDARSRSSRATSASVDAARRRLARGERVRNWRSDHYLIRAPQPPHSPIPAWSLISLPQTGHSAAPSAWSRRHAPRSLSTSDMRPPPGGAVEDASAPTRLGASSSPAVTRPSYRPQRPSRAPAHRGCGSARGRRSLAGGARDPSRGRSA